MRRLHFESLRPICPLCRVKRNLESALLLAHVEHEQDDKILEGHLHCSNTECLQEFPIIDGIPLIVPNVRGYVADNIQQLIARNDLSEATESLLGDAAGPNSPFDTTRQHLSTYAWDHYADLDPARNEERSNGPAPGAIVRSLDAGLSLTGTPVSSPAIDIGCSVGRNAFALAARSGGPVLGIDINLPMLRLASRVLTTGKIRYPLRRVGVVYDRREYQVDLEGSERVDFWACDALALPFAQGTFGTAVALNVLDCVASPHGLLESLRWSLGADGTAVLSTPYDWSPGATAVEAWIGGHSQRGPDRGASELLLRRLLTPGAHPQSIAGFEIVGETDSFPWHARLHARSIVTYDLHIVAARAGGC